MPKVTLLCHTPDAEKMVAAAAKLCYASADVDHLLENLTPEKTRSFLQMLVEMGHESPIEHVTFTFAIEGVSRSLLAQITRHRIASFSVQSQRYVNKSGFDYITPPQIAQNEEAAALYHQTMQQLDQVYNRLAALLEEQESRRLVQQEGLSPREAGRRAAKTAIEDARFVLPNACDTRMIVTMNARSLYNFFRQRCCNRAQWEIRQVAEQMLHLVAGVAPTLFAQAGPPCVSGPCPEGKMSCGQAAQVRSRYRREEGAGQ